MASAGGLMKNIILECPKCHFQQTVVLGAFNNILKFGGHKYTCPYCYWVAGETPNPYDNSVYMEIRGMSDE